jgi:hypothetical protein
MQFKVLKDDIRKKFLVIRDDIRDGIDNLFMTSKKRHREKISLLKITTY